MLGWRVQTRRGWRRRRVQVNLSERSETGLHQKEATEKGSVISLPTIIAWREMIIQLYMWTMLESTAYRPKFSFQVAPPPPIGSPKEAKTTPYWEAHPHTVRFQKISTSNINPSKHKPFKFKTRISLQISALMQPRISPPIIGPADFKTQSSLWMRTFPKISPPPQKKKKKKETKQNKNLTDWLSFKILRSHAWHCITSPFTVLTSNSKQVDLVYQSPLLTTYQPPLPTT